MSNITRNRLTHLEASQVFLTLNSFKDQIEVMNLEATVEFIFDKTGILIGQAQAGKYRRECGYKPRYRKPAVVESSSAADELILRISTLEKQVERLIVKLVQKNVL